MRIIQQTSTKLVLRQYPFFAWFIAGAILVSGFYGGALEAIYLAISHSITTGELAWKSGIGGTGELIIAIIIFLSSTFIGILADIQITTFDSLASELTIERRNLLRTQKIKHPLDIIEKAKLNEYEMNKYDLVIISVSGEQLLLISEPKEIIVKAILGFLEQHRHCKSKDCLD